MTARERVLAAVRAIQARDEWPTHRAICKETGLKSTQTVAHHLHNLERDGKITRERRRPHRITVCPEAPDEH